MSSNNARVGFVYYPDDLHYTQNDLHTWLPILKALGAHWLTLQSSPERAVPEPFLKGLIEAGIEPIIHIPMPIGRIPPTDLSPILRSYAQWGLHYVVIHDRPNLRQKWVHSEWGRKGLVERFLDHCIPILENQRTFGLHPVFPPLEPGGDYWDVSFLKTALESLLRRVDTTLIEELTLAIYAWTYDKPLDWGAGGPSQWPEAKPYHTPVNCQDQIGFRIFEWYSEISTQVVGKALPMLVVAGGALPSPPQTNSSFDPHTEQNFAIARALLQNQIPENVRNFAFHCLAAAEDSPAFHAAWYPTIETPLPIVEAFQRLLNLQIKQPTAAIRKPLKHYVLLPPDTDAVQALQAVIPFAIATKPVIGFSPKEARMAHQVTLFGDEAVIHHKVEEELLAAGCKVERLIVGTDSKDYNSQSPDRYAFEANSQKPPPGGSDA
ncbi:MAG: hypothetical protein GTO14_15165 [Anaerolineales bacterium]|nr:hypothetical protein [Anaerolineales bacterium]